MSSASSGPGSLRADARRNHHQVLDAARSVVLEHGPGVALDEIANAAGVGIGTLYRRFGDREGLFKAVVVRALQEARAAAEEALAEHDTGFDALAAYLRAALELRTAAVIPLVMDRLDLNDPELVPERESGAAVLEEIIARAHGDGTLPQAIDFADIGTMLVRLSRPLPGPLSRDADAELARRQLALFLAGLQHASDDTVDGAGMSRSELREPEDPETAAAGDVAL
jgi:AcrR family transcriptional regulator